MTRTILALAVLYSARATAAEAVNPVETELLLHGDVLAGFYDDRALYATAGRETQFFKFTRAILGVDARHPSGLGGLFEYNFAEDEPKRVAGNRAYVDWYKNLGTDLLYYGSSKARNAYLRYQPGENHILRVGRMVNLIGFDDEDLPYTGRLDAPHARYLDKEILNGVAYIYQPQPFFFDIGLLSGRGRPDSDYNWYLNGQTDPNTKDNNTPIWELRTGLRWPRFLLLGSYHETKTGSAPGNIYSGKHNDKRASVGFRASTGGVGFVDDFIVLGQASHYLVGLTENGIQGQFTPLASKDIEKNGWFATVGLRFGALSLWTTYEELDRMDSRVWAEVAKFDENHESFDSIERSVIYSVVYQINRVVSLTSFYRKLDSDYAYISDIPRAEESEYGMDKYGLLLRVQF